MDRTTIANIALSHLGNGLEMANVDTEQSDEARAVRMFWEVTLDEILRDFGWPFAKKVAALSLAEADPTSEWGFAYHYPSECLAMRKILSGIRNDTESSAIPFVEANGTAGTVIYTDQEDAVAEYTVRVTDANRYPSDFLQAFAALLAFYIAPRITGGDPNKLGTRAFELYRMHAMKAQANSMNEQRRDKEPEAALIRAREE